MNNLKERMIFVYYKILNYIGRLTTKKINIQSENETIDLIINNKVSASRFGDGEFAIMRGFENGFQNRNKILSLRLREIINSEEKNIIICIPDVFDSLKYYRKEYELFWIEYLDLKKERKEWNKFLNKKIYYNSFFTRPYMMYKDKSNCGLKFNELKKIWNKRDIVIVEGEGSRLGVGNDLFENSKTIQRILCPSKNAFDKYDEILSCVKKVNKNNLILIALGQTATVLSYDLSIAGYQAIDIGHIDIEYEWFLAGATEKIKIENKYVNEVKGGHEIHEMNDENYNNQIRYIIK